MRKLHIVAMSYDKDTALNALQRTGAVAITTHSPSSLASIPQVDAESLKTYSAQVENALNTLLTAIDNYEKEKDIKGESKQTVFDVSYAEFMSAGDKKTQMDETVECVSSLVDKKNKAKAEQVYILFA